MAQTIIDTVNKILKAEGGFVNNPDDRGGPTNFGITQKTLSAHLGRAATIDDVKNLDIETAKEIMLTNYFYAPGVSRVPEALQPEMFDMCYNHGPHNAISMLQKVINNSGWGPVVVDGAMGPQTIIAAGKCYAAMQGEMINALADVREAFCKAIANRDPSQQQFVNGWMNRDESFKV